MLDIPPEVFEEWVNNNNMNRVKHRDLYVDKTNGMTKMEAMAYLKKSKFNIVRNHFLYYRIDTILVYISPSQQCIGWQKSTMDPDYIDVDSTRWRSWFKAYIEIKETKYDIVPDKE